MIGGTVDLAGLNGGRVHLTSHELSQLGSADTEGSCVLATRAGAMPCCCGTEPYPVSRRLLSNLLPPVRSPRRWHSHATTTRCRRTGSSKTIRVNLSHLRCSMCNDFASLQQVRSGRRAGHGVDRRAGGAEPRPSRRDNGHDNRERSACLIANRREHLQEDRRDGATALTTIDEQWLSPDSLDEMRPQSSDLWMRQLVSTGVPSEPRAIRRKSRIA
jgi:hypothetical protein